MPGCLIQRLAAGFSESDSETSKEGNCCNTNYGPHVTTAYLSPADVKCVPPRAVLTESGRDPAHRNVDSSFYMVALGLHG